MSFVQPLSTHMLSLEFFLGFRYGIAKGGFVHWLSVGHANDILHLSLLACMSECSFLMRMSIVITIL